MTTKYKNVSVFVPNATKKKYKILIGLLKPFEKHHHANGLYRNEYERLYVFLTPNQVNKIKKILEQNKMKIKTKIDVFNPPTKKTKPLSFYKLKRSSSSFVIKMLKST